MERLREVTALVGERVRRELALGPKLRVKVEVVVPELLEPGKALEMEDRAE